MRRRNFRMIHYWHVSRLFLFYLIMDGKIFYFFFFHLADITAAVLNGQVNLETGDASSKVGAPTSMAAGGGLSTLSRKSGRNENWEVKFFTISFTMIPPFSKFALVDLLYEVRVWAHSPIALSSDYRFVCARVRIIDHWFSFFHLAGSGKNTLKSNDGRILARDLLKKRDLLLILLVSKTNMCSDCSEEEKRCLGLRNSTFGNLS